MTAVYLVTAGDYSDYSILAAFSTRERAEEYAKSRAREDAGVEEWELDEAQPHVPVVNVAMDADGVVSSIYASTCEPREIGFMRYIQNRLYWRVATDDEVQAVKVVNETRATILAHNAWGDAQRTRELFGQEVSP